MPGIGVISSIPFTGTPIELAFDQGLNIPGLHRNPQDDLGYDATALNAAMAVLDGDSQVTLIVAVGGIVTEQAAVNHTGKDVISLVGGVISGSPPPGTGGFRDRVSLESFNSNARRIAHLAQRGITLPNICLLYNPNSKMSDEERSGHAWGQPEPARIGKTTTNRPEVYMEAFNHITKQGIIVSADPWFYRTRMELVEKANDWLAHDPARRICYPLQDYENAAPTRSQTSVCGPSLLAAYEVLGKLAAHYIAGGPKPPLTLVQPPCRALEESSQSP